jgi:hypothetical protein
MWRTSIWTAVLCFSFSAHAQAPTPRDPYDPQLDPNCACRPDQDCDPDIDCRIDPYDYQQQDYQQGVAADNNAAQAYDDGYDPQAYQQFESELSPYGSWVDDGTYGRVWIPQASLVGDDFFPYGTGGQWSNTDYGWTWVSDYSWGWAPFHYGRWVTVGGYGWCWVPGRNWGPGWVTWRAGGGYAGWAPLPPHGVTIGPPGIGLGGTGPWRFTVAAQLGRRSMTYLPGRVATQVFGRTAVVSNSRTVNVNGVAVHVNAGPTSIAGLGSGVGVSTPASLRTVSPGSLPRPQITPRAGVAMQARPWFGRSAVLGGVHPTPSTVPVVRTPAMPYQQHPVYPAYQAHPAYNTVPSHPTVAPRPVYTPAYHATPSYPQYRAPQYSAPAYRPPSYQAPAYHAPAPVYRAPAPSYQAPAYHAPAPAPAAHPTTTYHAPAPAAVPSRPAGRR